MGIGATGTAVSFEQLFSAWRKRSIDERRQPFTRKQAVDRWFSLPILREETAAETPAPVVQPVQPVSADIPPPPAVPAEQGVVTEAPPPPSDPPPSSATGAVRYPAQGRPHPEHVSPSESTENGVWKLPTEDDPSVSAAWPGKAEHMCCDWQTPRSWSTLEEHGKGFVNFLRDADVREHARILNLPDSTADALAGLNQNLAEAVLALRWTYGLPDDVVKSLYKFADAWGTVPKSLPPQEQVTPKCRFLRLNRDWEYEADPHNFYKAAVAKHLTDYLLWSWSTMATRAPCARHSRRQTRSEFSRARRTWTSTASAPEATSSSGPCRDWHVS
jgi:hypothetical protein